MKKELELQASKRGKNDKIGEMRRQGQVPAVIYGQGIENTSITIKKQEFEKIYSHAGENHVINIDLDGKRHPVLVKDLQINTKNNSTLHVDFYQVDMEKEVEVELPLHFTGESRAVKELGGVLVHGIDFLHGKLKPGSLVDYIEVDLSVLAEPGQHISVAELSIPSGIKILNHGDEVVISVLESKAEAVSETAAPEEKKEAKK